MARIEQESKAMLLTLCSAMALRAIESAEEVDADQLKVHDDQKVEDLEFHIDVVVYMDDRSVSISALPRMQAEPGVGGLLAGMGMIQHIDALEMRLPFEWIPGYESR